MTNTILKLEEVLCFGGVDCIRITVTVLALLSMQLCLAGTEGVEDVGPIPSLTQ